MKDFTRLTKDDIFPKNDDWDRKLKTGVKDQVTGGGEDESTE